MLILAVMAVVLLGTVGFGAILFVLNGTSTDETTTDNETVAEIPKTQGMQIDLEHTENAGTVTLTLDRGGSHSSSPH